MMRLTGAILILFLSTLSLRRATAAFGQAVSAELYFYPRSPCGERRYWSGVPVVGRSISIHALLAESDGPVSFFNTFFKISIHALLAESDSSCGGR